jgi:hypothetical protein
MKQLLLAAVAALGLAAAVAPVANAAEFGLPQSSLGLHHGPYDDTGVGPGQTGLEGGGG